MKSDVQQRVIDLIHQQQSMIISSSSSLEQNNHVPETSYAPFYCDVEQQVFYALLSDLAKHSTNLQNHANASILIIEDEAKSEQIFARSRLQYFVRVEIVSDASKINQAKEGLKQRFGDIIDVLDGLADFNVYQFIPIKGIFVEGFGQAFTIKQGLLDDISPAMQDRQA